MSIIKTKKELLAALARCKKRSKTSKRISAVSSHGKLKKGSKNAKEYMAALRKHKATHPHVNLECEVEKSGGLHCEIEKPKKKRRKKA